MAGPRRRLHTERAFVPGISLADLADEVHGASPGCRALPCSRVGLAGTGGGWYSLHDSRPPHFRLRLFKVRRRDSWLELRPVARDGRAALPFAIDHCRPASRLGAGNERFDGCSRIRRAAWAALLRTVGGHQLAEVANGNDARI